MAIRMAQLIRLASSDLTGTDLVDMETRKRVWWSLYMADRWCSSGLNLPRQLRDGDIHLDLPIDETQFQNSAPGQTSYSAAIRKGLWAHKINLVNTYGRIRDFISDLGRKVLHEAEAVQQVAVLSSELDEWEQSVSAEFRFNEANLQKQRTFGQGATFLDLYLGYHYYMTLLFFCFLGSNTDLGDGVAYSQRCKQHALSYSRLLHRSRTLQDCRAVHPTVGHMTVVSSSVLIHTLSSEDRSDVKDLKDCLLANFEALVELKDLWPSCHKWVRIPHPFIRVRTCSRQETNLRPCHRFHGS
jgi:hypothetical protein